MENLDKLKRERWRIFYYILAVVLIFGIGWQSASLKLKNSSVAQENILNSENTLTKDADFGPFWKAWEVLNHKFTPASSTTPPLSPQDKVWGAVTGLAASYGDPYTTFFPPKESQMFQEEIKGSFGGVGMEIAIQERVLTVVSPIKGSPAERAGVKSGDKILKIGDKLSAKMPVEEAVSLIRGEQGTSVDITFARAGLVEPLVKTLVREAINIPTIDTKRMDNGIFLISLYSFTESSPDLFRNALREFINSGSDKLILDLRSNPGGYLEAAVSMASWFLPTGKLIVTEDFGGKEDAQVFRSAGYDVFTDRLKFVILVDGGSASASEILAGALREHHKAKLIGEKTFGKGSVQELVDISDGTSLKVTVAHWLTPNGNSISNGGLTPDIEAKPTVEDVKAGKDVALERAVQYLLIGK